MLLGVESMLTDVSSEMVNAVLPVYLTAELGFALLAYGFVDGLEQGVTAFVRIVSVAKLRSPRVAIDSLPPRPALPSATPTKPLGSSRRGLVSST